MHFSFDSAHPEAFRRHFAVITSPVRGHFDPLLVLAAAIQARGGRVTFIHVGDARAMLGHHPVGFHAVGGGNYPPGALAEYTRILGKASGPIGTMRMVCATARLCEMLCRELPNAIRDIGADMVLADVAEPAAALVARHLKTPFIGVITGLPLHPDPLVPPPYLSWQPDTSPTGLLRMRRAYAVTDTMMLPITAVLRKYATAWNLAGDPADVLSPLLNVAQCPPGLDYARTNASPPIAWCGPFRDVRAEAIDPPLSDGRPLVFCSLGTLQGGRIELFRAMSAACADVGARAVIAHCGLLTAAQIASLPGNPIVRAFWPQRALLRHVRAAIVHGGFNTALDCLVAGVPTVVVPIAFEQPGTAARLRAAGVAVVVPLRKLTRHSLKTALAQILDRGAYRQASQAFAACYANLGGADDAANQIMAASNLVSGSSWPKRPPARLAVQ